MRGKKFHMLFSALNGNEKVALKKHLSLNSIKFKKGVKELFDFILLDDFEMNILPLSEKEILSIILPSDNYTSLKYRDILYNGTIILEEFIFETELRNNKVLKKEILINFLYSRNKYDQCLKEINSLEKLIPVSKGLLSSEMYRLLYSLKIKKYFIEDIDYFKTKKTHIEDAIYYLDSFYFIEKLKNTNELLEDGLVTNKKYNIRMLDEVLKESKKVAFSNNTNLKIQYLITLFYKGNYSIENYFELKNEVAKVFDAKNSIDKRLIVIDLFNYIQKLCSLKYDIILIEEAHNINVLAIKNNCYIVNGSFQSHNAMNIANISLAANKTSWFENFLKENKHLIIDKDLQLILTAMLAVKKEDYTTASYNANKVSLKDTHYSIIAKTILIKSYLILKEYDSLDFNLKAVNQYFRRNKNLNELYIEANLNFVKTIEKIMKYNNNKSKLLQIKHKSQGLKNLAYKAWVLETINKLLI